MRTTVIIPDAWLPALRRLAKQQGKTLSRLLIEAAAEKLPRAERAKLPPASGPGRPKAS